MIDKPSEDLQISQTSLLKLKLFVNPVPGKSI